MHVSFNIKVDACCKNNLYSLLRSLPFPVTQTFFRRTEKILIFPKTINKLNQYIFQSHTPDTSSSSGDKWGRHTMPGVANMCFDIFGRLHWHLLSSAHSFFSQCWQTQQWGLLWERDTERYYIIRDIFSCNVSVCKWWGNITGVDYLQLRKKIFILFYLGLFDL